MTNPQTGGSYRRNPDGSLTLIEADAPAPIDEEMPADERRTETQDATDETSGKKGKA
ncbi:hypothetical protein GOZ94_01615 [Agrobacterium vitis]|uniref:hypothetical protein n=1 Tax=Agrobacterium vitis TaxID=373 RepID=UPI0012E731C0|nr:hypothetical protein [Agrobacterium vitis]MVA17642.1 hypothetical protein [Agrobacterium vitis]